MKCYDSVLCCSFFKVFCVERNPYISIYRGLFHYKPHYHTNLKTTISTPIFAMSTPIYFFYFLGAHCRRGSRPAADVAGWGGPSADMAGVESVSFWKLMAKLGGILLVFKSLSGYLFSLETSF